MTVFMHLNIGAIVGGTAVTQHEKVFITKVTILFGSIAAINHGDTMV